MTVIWKEISAIAGTLVFKLISCKEHDGELIYNPYALLIPWLQDRPRSVVQKVIVLIRTVEHDVDFKCEGYRSLAVRQ